MISGLLLMMAPVWYVPGWMRSEVPQECVIPALSNAFPKAEIAFKAWEISTEPEASCRRQWLQWCDKVVWPMAVESADKEAWRLTTHCRVLTPDRKCVAWGGKDEMTAAFEKVKLQVK